MSTNSVRPLRKYRVALILTIALLVVSCKSTKQTTRENSATQISSELLHSFDSIAHEAISRELLRMSERADDVTTQLLVFDTDKPADSLTGLPPVKAAMQQQRATKTKTATQATEHVESETQAHDTTATNGTLSNHWDGQTETVTSSASKWLDALLGTLGVITGLLVFYILIRILKK